MNVEGTKISYGSTRDPNQDQDRIGKPKIHQGTEIHCEQLGQQRKSERALELQIVQIFF